MQTSHSGKHFPMPRQVPHTEYSYPKIKKDLHLISAFIPNLGTKFATRSQIQDMMKKLLPLLLLFIVQFIPLSAFSVLKNYNISITVKGMKNQQAILAYYAD